MFIFYFYIQRFRRRFNLCTCSVNLIEGAAPGHMQQLNYYENFENDTNRELSVVQI